MTTEKMKRLKELYQKTTPGPWKLTLTEPLAFPTIYLDEKLTIDLTIDDMNFIDECSTALPELLDEVERLRARVELKENQLREISAVEVNRLIQQLAETKESLRVMSELYTRYFDGHTEAVKELSRHKLALAKACEQRDISIRNSFDFEAAAKKRIDRADKKIQAILNGQDKGAE